jgi:hypothetical protein
MALARRSKLSDTFSASGQRLAPFGMLRATLNFIPNGCCAKLKILSADHACEDHSKPGDLNPIDRWCFVNSLAD